MAYNLGYVDAGGYNLGYTGAFTGGPSISAADDATEDQSATVTLANNEAAPTELRLGSTVVSFTFDSGVMTYTAPLLPNNPALVVEVDVDGVTISTVIAYTNTYDMTHTPGEVDADSIIPESSFGTTQLVELKVVTDADSEVLTVNWSAYDADNFESAVSDFVTAVSEVAASTDVVIGYHITETGETGTFTRTLEVEDVPADTTPDPQPEPAIVRVFDNNGATSYDLQRASGNSRCLIYIRAQTQPAFDADALAYITAVETADGQALEAGVREAINAFVVGCKADGIWDAIKASCILAGARTLTGALVPLKGAAPTNFNFVSGDYDRVTGLKGNGTTKHLNSNRNNNADPQNSQHALVFLTQAHTDGGAGSYIDSGLDTGDTLVTKSGISGRMVLRSRHPGGASLVVDNIGNPVNLVGVSRASSTQVTGRMAGQNFNFTNTSTTPSSNPIIVFARFASPVTEHTDARIAFYSIGEHLNLAQLESRVATLLAGYAASAAGGTSGGSSSINSQLSYNGVISDYHSVANNRSEGGQEDVAIDIWDEGSLPVSAGLYSFSDDTGVTVDTIKAIFELEGVPGHIDFQKIINPNITVTPGDYSINLSESLTGDLLIIGFGQSSATTSTKGSIGQTDVGVTTRLVLSYKLATQDSDQVGISNAASNSFSFAASAIRVPFGGPSTPDQFTFTDQTDVALSTVIESNAITITGVDPDTDIPVTISGGEYAVSTDGGSTFGAFTSAGSNVQLNHQIKVRVTSSGDNSTAVSATLTAGGVSDTFTVTTEAFVDETPPVITILGDNPLTITEGDTFTDPGATALDDVDGDITGSIVVTGSVDANTPGEYVLTYSATDEAGNTGTATRTVIVEAAADVTAPVVTLIGDATITLTEGDTYTEQGATAVDDVDGDLTGSIVITGTVDTSTPDTYTLTYSATDSSGNTGTATRTVIVEAAPDVTAPVVTLLGDNPITLTVGDTFTDPGATALDDVDGDVTASIVVTGAVDTGTEGTYTLTYTATDSAGNEGTATRSVVVEAAQPEPAAVFRQVEIAGSLKTATDNGDLNVWLGDRIHFETSVTDNAGAAIQEYSARLIVDGTEYDVTQDLVIIDLNTSRNTIRWQLEVFDGEASVTAGFGRLRVRR